MNQSDELHDLLIDMINEVEKDMEVYEIRKRLFKKRNNLLKPSMAYRTGELLHYMYIKCNENVKKLQAMHILEDCFQQCTRAVLYYINLKDLKTIILRHKDENEWCISIENNSDIC